MKGDFSRITFDKANHFRRVLMQQGRVTLDADFNEQVAIFLHYVQTLAHDLIGPYGAPEGIDGGFSLTVDPEKKGGFFLSKGRYYVDGILVESETNRLYKEPHVIAPGEQLQQAVYRGKNQTLWVYLDVWERHITSIDNDAIREKALGGPDTCTRTEVVWQVKALSLNKIIDDLKKQYNKSNSSEYELGPSPRHEAIVELQKCFDGKPANPISCGAPLALLHTVSNVSLSARVVPVESGDNGDNCLIAPDSKYRSLENHLYRVEIHRGGPAGIATFKWSRNNGNVVARTVGTDGHGFVVSNPHGFEASSWVELIDDSQELQGGPGTLVKLAKVEGNVLTIDPASVAQNISGGVSSIIRCWDQTERGDITLVDGAIPIIEKSDKDSAWIDLEDGMQIQFSSSQGEYRTGDYWLIPARGATGSIEWPMEQEKVGGYKSLPPHGVEHHYAPLGFMTWDSDGALSINNCRCTFSPMGAPSENK
jgi:hypothetical protein